MKNQCNILIKSFVFIGAFFMTHQIHGMDVTKYQPSQPNSNYLKFERYWAHAELRKKLPPTFAFFDRDTVLSDEFFANANPEWQRLKDELTQENKEQLLRNVEYYFRTDEAYPKRRCLWAQLIALGADALTQIPGNQVLTSIVRMDDYQLAKYAVTKIDSKKVDVVKIFKSVKSLPMAQLLIEAGIPVSGEGLIACVVYDRPLALFDYYLEQGANPNYQDSDKWTVLDNCTYDRTAMKYVPSLLNAGAHLDIKKYVGESIFHEAIVHQNPKFCECVIQHLLVQYETNFACIRSLRNKAPEFYRIVRPFRKTLVPHFSPLQKLKHALELKNADGRTAYEISGWEILNPENCTYPKLKALLPKESQEK